MQIALSFSKNTVQIEWCDSCQCIKSIDTSLRPKGTKNN
jgi:hypothetical protein